MKSQATLKLVVAGLLFALLPAELHAVTAGQVFGKVKDSVVIVKTLDRAGNETGFGSGVLLPSGKIATNCHVVEGGAAYLIGGGEQFVPATLYAEDRDKDICLLDAKVVGRIPVELGKAATLKVGDRVYAVGAPHGLELSLSDGLIAQLRGGPPPIIQTTAAISPGSSGGGLFDSNGKLVGLTTLYMEGGQSLNFAMPVEWIDDVKPGRKVVTGEHGESEWSMRVAVAALMDAEDWLGLFALSQRWTRSEPNNASTWTGLGYACTNLGRFNDAIDAYRQAIRIDPEVAIVWLLLGKAHGFLGRYNDAVDAFRQVIRIDPEFAEAWYHLGFAYNSIGRHNDAIDASRQAVRIDPEDVAAWSILGRAYNSIGRHNDAIDAYRQAIRIDPERASDWASLGLACIKLGRYNDAIDANRQAIRIDPEHASAWHNLALTHVLSGNRGAALDALKELRRLDPAMADKLFDIIVPR